MDWLQVLWFVIIAILWIGFMFLEGFDFGVGMLMKLFAKNDTERRVLLNTIGPVWDGNEVWLVTAIGAMFAAFPYWYASLLSGLYIPIVLLLLALIFRATGIDYRGKIVNTQWAHVWDWAICLGSLVAPAAIGVLLVSTTLGMPNNSNGDYTEGAFGWLNWQSLLGAVFFVSFSLVQGAAFLSLKTDGEVYQRIVRWVPRFIAVPVITMIMWTLLASNSSPTVGGVLLLIVSVVFSVVAFILSLKRHMGWTFFSLGIFLVTGMGSILVALFPRVLPSTLSPEWSLTISNASSSDYTLSVMSIVASFGIPLVLGYQTWSYWIFRKRIGTSNIPRAHKV